MKKKTTKRLVIENIILLVFFVFYGLYKNGYLIYQRGLINKIWLFKNIYLVLIAILIKIGYDLIKNKKIIINYDFVYLVLVSMIVPYNTNLIVYTIVLTITYIISNILEKYFKFNKVCSMFLIIYLVNGLIINFSYDNLLEANFAYSFSLFDILAGRSIGGISSTCIILSFISYIYLVNTLYYKKEIPLVINITYLLLSFIYYLVTNENIILNSELIFSSIFISSLPEFSPYLEKLQNIYGIFTALLSFILLVLFHNLATIYLSILVSSIIFMNFPKIISKS